jgi:hypothetical protein
MLADAVAAAAADYRDFDNPTCPTFFPTPAADLAAPTDPFAAALALRGGLTRTRAGVAVVLPPPSTRPPPLAAAFVFDPFAAINSPVKR